MAITPNATYPTKTTAPSADYPLGGAKDVTTPGDGTGTPWVAAIVNDWFGWFQALLDEASVTATGNADTAVASQYLEAARKLFGATFETRADLALSASVVVDQLVITQGKTTADDGEMGMYRIVAAGTGTVDGENYIDLPNADSGSGLQAKLLRMSLDKLTLISNSITTTDTLTAAEMGRLHLISGTTADYTITLPAAADVDNQLLRFRVLESATKTFTLDGNAAETIDGATTLDLGAGDYVVLWSDGTNWRTLVKQIVSTGSPTLTETGSVTANASAVATILRALTVTDGNCYRLNYQATSLPGFPHSDDDCWGSVTISRSLERPASGAATSAWRVEDMTGRSSTVVTVDGSNQPVITSSGGGGSGGLQVYRWELEVIREA